MRDNRPVCRFQSLARAHLSRCHSTVNGLLLEAVRELAEVCCPMANSHPGPPKPVGPEPNGERRGDRIILRRGRLAGDWLQRWLSRASRRAQGPGGPGWGTPTASGPCRCWRADRTPCLGAPVPGYRLLGPACGPSGVDTDGLVEIIRGRSSRSCWTKESGHAFASDHGSGDGRCLSGPDLLGSAVRRRRRLRRARPHELASAGHAIGPGWVANHPQNARREAAAVQAIPR